MEVLSESQNTSSVTQSHQFTLVSIQIPHSQQPASIKSCRICMEQTQKGFISPCKCSGSMKWVHSRCLKTWLMKTAATMIYKKFKNIRCEVCDIKYSFENQKQKQLDCSSIKKNYPYNKTEYIQFLVAALILLVIIIIGCIFVSLLGANDQQGEILRQKIPSHESVKIALIAILLILGCVIISLVIIFVVEFGTRTLVTITRIYDYFPDDKKAKKNKITPY